MNSRTWKRTMAVLAALIATIALATACSSSKKSTTGGQTSGNAPNTIVVQNFSFSPGSLTVPVGTKVTWKFEDSTAHTATADNGTFKSSALSGGQTFEFTFTKAGTYSYMCSIHPSMKGSITVQ